MEQFLELVQVAAQQEVQQQLVVSILEEPQVVLPLHHLELQEASLH